MIKTKVIILENVIYKRVPIIINPNSVFIQLLNSQFSVDGRGFMISCIYKNPKHRIKIMQDIYWFVKNNRESYNGYVWYRADDKIKMRFVKNHIVIFDLGSRKDNPDQYELLKRHCAAHRIPMNSVVIVSPPEYITHHAIQNSDFIYVPKYMKLDERFQPELAPPATSTIIRY